MIFHTKYTITLDRLSKMLETDNKRLLLRFKWLPVYVSQTRYEHFMLDYNSEFNAEEIDYIVESSVDKINLRNKIEITLPAIFSGLAFTPDKKFREYFKLEIGQEYKDEKDLKHIVNRIKKLSAKYRELTIKDRIESNNEGISFEKIVNYVETVLERTIDRGIKLYQFRFAYESAVEKGKALKKMSSKNG